MSLYWFPSDTSAQLAAADVANLGGWCLLAPGGLIEVDPGEADLDRLADTISRYGGLAVGADNLTN